MNFSEKITCKCEITAKVAGNSGDLRSNFAQKFTINSINMEKKTSLNPVIGESPDNNSL